MATITIKVYDALENLQADAVGTATHTHTVGPQGLYRNTEDWNDMRVIKLYTDDNGTLFGLWFPKT